MITMTAVITTTNPRVFRTSCCGPADDDIHSFFIPSTTPAVGVREASSSFCVSSTAVSTMDCKTFFCSVASKTSFGFVALRSSSAAALP